MEDVQARRLAQNETIFRQVNEHVRAAEERVQYDYPSFICECSKIDCDQHISVPLVGYREVRESPAHFLVAVGHGDDRIEKVIESHDNYEVVEKVGPGRDVAEEKGP